jgi:DNA-binding response OmpR family regulator
MTDTSGTILIIDDDLSLQAMLDMALRKENYTVVAAHDGQEGLELIETLQPDLIISDIMMPNMDGVEMFQYIKERLQDDGIPIIVMTALTPKPWFADLEAEGAAIFQKPFEINKLVDLINMLLE